MTFAFLAMAMDMALGHGLGHGWSVWPGRARAQGGTAQLEQLQTEFREKLEFQRKAIEDKVLVAESCVLLIEHRVQSYIRHSVL